MPKAAVLPALWPRLRREATAQAKQEPALKAFLHNHIIDRINFAEALAFLLAGKLANTDIGFDDLSALMQDTYRRNPALINIVLQDLCAILSRDPAVRSAPQALLYLKGFHALQAHRIAHILWKNDQPALAYFLQSRTAEVMNVDIHPAAKIGHGVMLDHGTGIVIGETATVGNNVSMLHGVTLGGTGKERGDRHPKIGDGVLLGAGCHVLGNIKIGKGAKIAASSVVLDAVLPHTTVAGIPAKPVGRATGVPGMEIDHCLDNLLSKNDKVKKKHGRRNSF